MTTRYGVHNVMRASVKPNDSEEAYWIQIEIETKEAFHSITLFADNDQQRLALLNQIRSHPAMEATLRELLDDAEARYEGEVEPSCLADARRLLGEVAE